MQNYSESQSGTLMSLWSKYQGLPRGRKFLVTVFAVWALQAAPKWTVAITADGEMSARIMTMFVTPRTELNNTPTFYTTRQVSES